MKLENIKIEGEFIAIVRDHWLTSFKPFLLLLLGWTIFFFLFFLSFELRSVSIFAGAVLLIIDLAIILTVHHFVFIFSFERFMSDIIVTTEELIEVKFLFLVRDDISSSEIEQIHSIEKEKHGMLRNILNYGDVFIYFAGKSKVVHLQYLCNPTEFVRLLQTVKHKTSFDDINFHSINATCSKNIQNITWPQIENNDQN